MEGHVWAAEALVGVGLVIAALEFFAVRGHYQRDGLLSWEVLRLRLALTARFFKGFSDAGLAAILACQLVGAGLLLTPLGGPWRVAALGVVLAAMLLLSLRAPYGLDGADQMALIVLAGVLVFHLASPQGWLRDAALWFIAAQACLAYLTAGIAKLVSPQWRDGSAITQVLSTRTYGNPLAHRLFQRRPWLGPVACWSVIGFEVLFPLVLLVPSEPARLAFLAFGALFHVVNAFVMGLNTFLWSFTATYPAIAWCATEIRVWG